ncbi:MAG: bifunctional helix-turn-helix transcriptional regulator/GNAT family N-acetyltransferase [Bacteroidota bacterium]|jgi:DNA-binding MarR family transcriptional regulator/L-amino acid N-acyltransferase YncA
MDVITTLGELAFASRLRRISDRLARDVSLLYHKLDIDFEARWFSLFYALTRWSSLTITGAAELLGISHTAVNQIAKELNRHGLVAWSAGRHDRRQQHLRLTDHGRRTAKALTPVWNEIRAATKDLLDSTGGSFPDGMEKIERELDLRNMYERVWLRLHGTLPADIEIREYHASLKKYFRSLNTEWLEAYFSVENADRRLLDNPKGTIVNKGGSIFFACTSDAVIGTCALIRHRDGTMELAKMAVTKKHQGRGIGRLLSLRVIRRTEESGARELYLCTNPKLKAANHLYRSLGFRKTRRHPLDLRPFQRPTIVMKLDLPRMNTPTA